MTQSRNDLEPKNHCVWFKHTKYLKSNVRHIRCDFPYKNKNKNKKKNKNNNNNTITNTNKNNNKDTENDKDKEEFNDVEEIFLCEQKMMDPFQRSHPLLSGHELCAQFIPLSPKQNAMIKARYSIQRTSPTSTDRSVSV